MSLVLAVVVSGCGALMPRGAQVPLPVDESSSGLTNGGVLMHMVIDVLPDPKTGTPIIATGDGPMKWPNGFTAWRVGSEVEVLDASGNRVLLTGRRYLFRCSQYMPVWTISQVVPCPDCQLGFQLE